MLRPLSTPPARHLFGVAAPDSWLQCGPAGVPGLQEAVAAVGAVESRPVLTVLAGWEGPDAAAWAANWLPCEAARLVLGRPLPL